MNDNEIKNYLRILRDSAVEFDLPFLISVVLIGIGLSWYLRWFYIKYGKSNTDRKVIADSFPLLVISIIMIIYLIKSSIALSLGLVGALSIVRFRAAIKEPEELIYILFVIAIGLGLGAKQVTPVLIIFFITISFLFLRSKFSNNLAIDKKVIINLSINKENDFKDILKEWNLIISNNGSDVDLYKIEQNEYDINVTYTVKIKSFEDLNTIRNNLVKLIPNSKLSIIDNTMNLILS
jgi:hypothetical protein